MERKTPLISPEDLRRQEEISDYIKSFWEGQGKTPLAYVETYGCQQNEADSEQIRGILERCGYGLTDTAEGADLVIINTCAIREHAEQRVFGNVGALVHTKRRHPGQKIFVCGCMMGQPEVAERMRKSYPHVDGVFNPHHLWQLPEQLYRVLIRHKKADLEESAGAIAEGLPVVRTNKLKAWVSIMYGCNNFCTYCIVPYVRGRERSRLPEDILAECRELIAQGYKEITLLGQNVNSYGKDLGLGVDFADLLGSIAELDGEFVLRFMTSHPRDASRKLFDTMAAHEKIAKQFHLPFQSGNDRILKAMNRHYDRARYLELIEYGRKVMPEIVFTSDVIVGFPGETEEEFEDTLTLIEQVRFDALFTFIFSPRPGTPAARCRTRRRRRRKTPASTVWSPCRTGSPRKSTAPISAKPSAVLVDGREEGDKDGRTVLTGRTDGGRLVRFPGDETMIGKILPVTVTGATTWSLVGEPAARP